MKPTKRMHRLLQWMALAGLGCHPMVRDGKPLSPIATCARCCSQALDVCMVTDGSSVAATCPPQYRQCTDACEKGDENEMCVVQTNRELASAAPKPPLLAPALPPQPKQLGECDQKGTWTLEVAHTEGKAQGCVALAGIPKTVRFRIGRSRDAYVLYDLVATPGWTDAFKVENGANECVVTLERNNRQEPDQPRSLAITLKAHDRKVSGTLSYREVSGTLSSAEANRPDGCALAAPIAGRVVAPPPERSPAQPAFWPPPPRGPLPTSNGLHR